MGNKQYFKNKVFSITSYDEFQEVALQLFAFQSAHNAVYNKYLSFLKVNPSTIKTVEDIPFLPIQFFKSYTVKTGNYIPKIVFSSSATGGLGQSKHQLDDVEIYNTSYLKAFHLFYGDPSEYCFLALLPSYLEREGSSLINMCQGLMLLSRDKDSGFYLDEFSALSEILQRKKNEEKKVLLIGVSFALLDFAEAFPKDLQYCTIMETGGMKGRRKEVVRTELHDALKTAFNAAHIHSEYGMTELLSQAYSQGEGVFETPPWMQVLVRQTDDPFSQEPIGKSGGLNIIDLANIDSCAFVETMDLGRKLSPSTFEVLGRFDYAEVRGCNLLIH